MLKMPKKYLLLVEQQGISLEKYGINEVAFDANTALIAISTLKDSNVVILGGDVYQWNDNEAKLTYDNWYIPEYTNQLASIYLENSWEKAEEFINEYREQNGEGFIYSLVLSIFPNP